jgi:hypothetical protein
VNTFRDAFLDVRRRIEAGEDPEQIVPPLLHLAESQEEIEMAEALFEDEVETDEDEQ